MNVKQWEERTLSLASKNECLRIKTGSSPLTVIAMIRERARELREAACPAATVFAVESVAIWLEKRHGL